MAERFSGSVLPILQQLQQLQQKQENTGVRINYAKDDPCALMISNAENKGRALIAAAQNTGGEQTTIGNTGIKQIITENTDSKPPKGSGDDNSHYKIVVADIQEYKQITTENTNIWSPGIEQSGLEFTSENTGTSTDGTAYLNLVLEADENNNDNYINNDARFNNCNLLPSSALSPIISEELLWTPSEKMNNDVTSVNGVNVNAPTITNELLIHVSK